MRAPALGLTALLATSLSASAQETANWAALFHPDRFLERLMHTALATARTQVDLKYGDIAVSILGNSITVTDVLVWPLFEYDEDGDCEITADRVVLRGMPIEVTREIRLAVSVFGLRAQRACLPPDAQPMAGTLGLSEFDLPYLTLDAVYDLAEAEADISLRTALVGALGVTFDAEFSYLSLYGREDPDEPEVVAYLSEARLELEDLGAWTSLQPMLPPGFNSPEQAELTISGLLGTAIGSWNSSEGPQDLPDPSALNDSQTAFVESGVAAWQAFLAAPERLVLETGIDPTDGVFLDYELYEEDPRVLFDDFQPVLATVARPRQTLISAALLQAALTNPDALSSEERSEVGHALMSGEGAPRNRLAGTVLLAGLAEAGDGYAAIVLAEEAEAQGATLAAYDWALVAGEAGEVGAAALLDRLEARLTLAEVLESQLAQSGRAPFDAMPFDAPMSQVRASARAALNGQRAARSYEAALAWGSVLAALGDAEGADILAEIDNRMARRTEAERVAWQAVEARIATAVMERWLAGNLPERLR